MCRTRVLIVDDDPSTMGLVRAALPRAELLQRATVRRASEVLRAGVFDVLILELVLPGANGVSLLRHLPDPVRPLFVVVLTGWRPGALKALELGAEVVLIKPCSVDALQAAVSPTQLDQIEVRPRMVTLPRTEQFGEYL
jgi:DNA-binding response OmpR family regulator